MKFIPFILVTSLLFVPAAIAKRGVPVEVSPVIYEGTKYHAPHTKMGVVEARDKATHKLLWEQKIYSVKIDPQLERDVQDVFITKLELADGQLIVTNENHARYALDLKTRWVKKLDGTKDPLKK